MSSEVHNTIMKKLHAALAAEKGGRADMGTLSESLQSLVRANRLEGLFYAWDEISPPENWQQLYRKRQLQGQKMLASGREFSAALEEAQIPCIALRGPFDAAWLYGDLAARAFSDIDLYVPRSAVAQAWSCAKDFGFELYHHHMPKGFYLRNHLNWALHHRECDFMCDLHWAVDHPFQSLRIDYPEIFERSRFVDFEGKRFRIPCAEDWLLLTAQHFLKHVDDLTLWVAQPEALLKLAEKRLLKYAVDLAFFFEQQPELDWPVIKQRAQAWGIQEALYSSVLASAHLLEGKIPDEILTEAQGYVEKSQHAHEATNYRPSAGWLNRLSRKQGFNMDRIHRLRDYCWPTAQSHVGLSRKLARLGYAVPRLFVAGLDTVICLGIAQMRRRLARTEICKSSMQVVEVKHG